MRGPLETESDISSRSGPATCPHTFRCCCFCDCDYVCDCSDDGDCDCDCDCCVSAAYWHVVQAHGAAGMRAAAAAAAARQLQLPQRQHYSCMAQHFRK